MEIPNGSGNPRRRSIASHPAMTTDDLGQQGGVTATEAEEEQRLLPEENLPHRDITDIRLEKSIPRNLKRNFQLLKSTWSGLLAVAILVGLTFVAWQGLSTKYDAPPLTQFISSEGTYEAISPVDNRTSEILLHPKDHIFRGPKIQTFHWKVTAGYRWPDGVKKRVYLINGQFPGPTIEARPGDTLIVEVENALNVPEENEDVNEKVPEDSISIHWHGLYMRGNNHMDGAEGFTQCGIPVGGNFTYEFQIENDQHGTFWYHAHSQVQRGDGLYGGLIVHRAVADEKGSEIERYGYSKEILWLAGDWYHRSAEDILAWYTSVRAFGNEPVPDSMIINGVGRFKCLMAVPARPVVCRDIKDEDMGGLISADLVPTRIRIINVGSLAGMMFRVPGASFTPIQVDGGCEIAGSPSESIGIVYPGDRVDIVINWQHAQTGYSPQLEVYFDPENFGYPNLALTANQSFPILPPNLRANQITPSPSDLSPMLLPEFDLQTTTSINEPEIPSLRDVEHKFVIYTKTEKLARYANHPMGFINHTSWIPQHRPLLALPRSEWDEHQFLPYIPVISPFNGNDGKEAEWLDIVINNLDDGSHPFHLHGHNFYILAVDRAKWGWGSYNPFSDEAWNPTPDFNFETPLRKDTVTVPRHGYAILRIKVQNPGLWMLHCHVLVHQASGMAMGIHLGAVGDESHALAADSRAEQLCNI